MQRDRILVTGGTGTLGRHVIPIASGIDRAMFGYFGSKLAAERIIADSGVPWTTLRATQFHDLLLKVAQQMAKLPVIPVPAGFRFQPVDAGEVAARLVDLALGAPAGLVPDMGGPRVYGMDALLRGYLRARGKRRPMLPIWLPGKAARAFRAGANLAPERSVGQRTWEDFLGSAGDRQPQDVVRRRREPERVHGRTVLSDRASLAIRSDESTRASHRS